MQLTGFVESPGIFGGGGEGGGTLEHIIKIMGGSSREDDASKLWKLEEWRATLGLIEQTGGAEFATRFAQQAGMGRSTSPAIDIRSVPFNQLAAAMSSSGLETMEQLAKLRKYSSQLAGHFPDIKSAQAQIASLRQIGAFLQPYEEALMLNIAGYATAIPVGAATQGHKGLADISYGAQLSGLLMGANKEFGLVNPRTGMPKFMEERWKALDEKTSIDIQDITAKYRAEAADAIEASGKKPNALIEKYHGTMAGLKAADEILSTKMKNLFTKLEESGFSEAGELQRESKLGTTEVDRTMLRKGADTIRRLAEARYKAMPTPVNKELLGAATELAESGWEYSQKPKEMEQTQAAFEGEGVGGGRFGTLARRLFSGFGLMYIRSIFGLMGTGAYTGYGERMQLEATMAQQLLGVGGQMPITPTSELERVQAIQYGGQGGLALKSAQAAFMREQQPFYNLFTSGLAGVSGGGMAMWLMQTGWPELGKQVTNRVGVGVGAAITAGSAALNIYGASQDVQGSAMNIAVRQAAGENISRNAILSVLLGTGIGAGGGALIGGGVPGALIGGGIGLISGIGANAQFIASGLNPEIARQTEILQALAGRGQVPIQSILGNYGVAPTQYAYYAQQAAMVQSSQVGNLGISPEAWGATAAYELRRNTSLGDYWRQRFAAAAQSGFNAETYGVMATQLLGMPVLEAQGGPQNAPTQTSYTSTPIPYNLLENPNAAIGNAVLGAVNWLSGGVVENKYAQKPISYQTGGVSSGTQISPIAQWSNAILRWSATQPSPDIAKERIESAFGALGEMGVYGAEYLQKNVIGQPATISEARRRMLEQREYEVAGGGQKAISELQTDVEFEKTLQYSERLAALKSRGWLAPYQAQLQLQTLQKSLGLPEIQVPELAVWETKAVNPLEQYQMQLATTRQTLITSAPEQQITAQYQFGGQFAQTLMQGGVSTENAINVGNILATMTPEKFAQYQGLLSLNPLGTAAWAMSNQQGALELMQRGSVPGMGGTTIPTANFGLADINAGGLTGLPWGTTSMAKPMEVAAMMRQGLPMAVAVATSANNMGAVLWGRGYQQRTDINQGLAQALLTGGQFGAQAYQQIQMAGFQMASAGVQLQQIALQREYQPQFWALEDRSRALGYAQTEWGFGQQQAQLNMQQRFWQQNFGLNVQQAQMQRGWTQQDWGYQTNVRNMQWQWQQEDFAEQARFMTGRDRRLAERQMGRATIMHDLEGEQIDKQRSRQKELWALEDERFRIARAQNQEQLQFQQQAIEKQRSFYEERKAIEEEQVRLQREYWEKNMDLQEKAAGISAAAAAAQIENARTMLEATQNIQAESAKPGLANPVTMGTLAETLTELNPLMLTFIENIGKVKGALQGIGTGAGNDVIWTTVEEAMKTEIGRQEYSEGRDINGNGIIGRAIGGPSLGQLSLIGEAGPELLKLPIASSVFPNGILKASEYGMTSFADPWQNPSVFATPQFSHSEKQAINIYLGNELLGTWVVDKVNHEIGV